MTLPSAEPSAAPRAWLERLRALDVIGVCALAFGAVAVIGCLWAFVGLGASSFWADELFTLFLVDHTGGASEVMHRALTDTHPPGYYLLLHAWGAVAGWSPTAMRAPSAVFAVAAIALFALTVRRGFRPAAVAFACAVATTSPFWFFQAQNARNYALCLMLTAAVMAIAARIRIRTLDGRPPWAAAIGLLAVGALLALSHFYGLLTFGFVIGWLILTLPAWRLRGLLAFGGLVILAADLAYIRLLTAHTQQDIHGMWVRDDAAHLLGVLRETFRSAVVATVQYGVAALLLIVLVGAVLRRPLTPTAGTPDDRAATRRWLLGGSAFVVTGVYLAGVAISLVFAPSLSDQNLLVAAPFLWVLWAALFERAFDILGPRARPWVAGLLIVLLAGQVVIAVRGRPLSRNEQWRGSADYIASIKACDGAQIPVLRPYKFGPNTPFFRTLTERYFYGRFLPGHPLLVRSPEAFTGPDPDLAAMLTTRARDPGACPVLAWAVHDYGPDDAKAIRARLAALPGLAPSQVRLRTFVHYRRSGLKWTRVPSGFVLEAVR